MIKCKQKRIIATTSIDIIADLLENTTSPISIAEDNLKRAIKELKRAGENARCQELWTKSMA